MRVSRCAIDIRYKGFPHLRGFPKWNGRKLLPAGPRRIELPNRAARWHWKWKSLTRRLCLWRCVPKRNDLRRWRCQRWHSRVYSIALFVRCIPFVFQPSVGGTFSSFKKKKNYTFLEQKWQRCTVKGAPNPFNLNSIRRISTGFVSISWSMHSLLKVLPLSAARWNRGHQRPVIETKMQCASMWALPSPIWAVIDRLWTILSPFRPPGCCNVATVRRWWPIRDSHVDPCSGSWSHPSGNFETKRVTNLRVGWWLAAILLIRLKFNFLMKNVGKFKFSLNEINVIKINAIKINVIKH